MSLKNKYILLHIVLWKYKVFYTYIIIINFIYLVIQYCENFSALPQIATLNFHFYISLCYACCWDL